MWACCADYSSDDDDHNTSNTLLLLCADAFIAPALFVGLSDVDELMVALSCRFSKTDPFMNPSFWLTILVAASGSEAWPRSGSLPTARVGVHPCHLPHVACLLKVSLDQNDPGLPLTMVDPSVFLRALAGI